MQDALNFLLSPAGPADAAALAELHVKSWRETYPGILPRTYLERMSPALHEHRWRLRLAKTNEVTLAAEDRSGLVGYVSGDWTRGAKGEDGLVEISTLYVLKRAQGRGLGLALFEGCARVLAARGAKALIVWALRENHPARGFYERIGGVRDRMGEEYVGGAVVPSVRYRWADLGSWLRG
jgi:GNAT superfamily N-acetyltransferase